MYEFLTRLHPYCEENNNNYASLGFNLASMELYNTRAER